MITGLENGIMKRDSNGASVSNVSLKQIAAGKEIGSVSGLTVISPQQRRVAHYDQSANVEKIVIGGEQLTSTGDKIVLLLGSKNGGKTSVIDSMLNYLYAVKREDRFRFKLRKDNTPTTCLTEYVINNTILPFSVAVVDTPGLVDEKGYSATSTIINEWFRQEIASTGQFRVDAISVVLHSDEDELGWPFIHELAEVKRLFGDDLKTNVLPIITNTEILPQPLAVHALAYANVTFLEYYKVNNDAFVPCDDVPSTGATRTRRNHLFLDGYSSFERYFSDLRTLKEPMMMLSSPQDPTPMS